jgi:GMP synthase-like glutamine amidotransferase
MTRVLVIQHVASAPLAAYGEVLDSRGARVELVDCEAGDPMPATLDGIDGVISLGGPQSLHAPAGLAWLEPELELLRRAVAEGVPVYGVCLGAQLLAMAFGGRVYAGPVPEVGPAPVRLTPAAADDPVFGTLDAEIPAFHWHADTFDLPAGAVLLASSERYPNQAFRIGASGYGVQFHAESSLATVRGMTELGTTAAQLERALGPGAAGRVLAAAERELPAVHAIARQLLTAWLEVCTARRAARAPASAR